MSGGIEPDRPRSSLRSRTWSDMRRVMDGERRFSIVVSPRKSPLEMKTGRLSPITLLVSALQEIPCHLQQSCPTPSCQRARCINADIGFELQKAPLVLLVASLNMATRTWSNTRISTSNATSCERCSIKQFRRSWEVNELIPTHYITTFA